MYGRECYDVRTEGQPHAKEAHPHGNSLALVLDKKLLDRVGIDADTTLDVSTNGQVIVVSPVRDRRRSATVKKIVAEAHDRYGGVFRRLAE